jgi:uncharacterized protein
MSTVTPQRVRYASLDVLRGLAILGTLGTNIWIFTNPEGLVGYLNRSTAASTPPVWTAVEAILQQLTQGKFLGLLTLMFGIGLEIQRRSAERAGRPWPGRYPWRAGLLFLDGLLHYLLVVEFDVLMGYAVTGLVVAYLLATRDRTQHRWLVAAAVTHLALLSLVTVALLVFTAPSTGAARLDPNPYADGSWLDLVRFRIDNAGLFRLEPVFITALSVAMFLLGARLVRLGVLEDAGHRLRIRLLRLGAVAFVVDLVLGLTGGAAGVVFARYGTAPLVALGLLALVVELMSRRRQPVDDRARGTRWLAAVGRMALSSYVLQNLVASTLCYGWGFGLAARLPGELFVPGTLVIYLVTAAVVVVAANLWLRRFSRGPVELAWVAAYDALTRRFPAPVAKTYVSRG